MKQKLVFVVASLVVCMASGAFGAPAVPIAPAGAARGARKGVVSGEQLEDLRRQNAALQAELQKARAATPTAPVPGRVEVATDSRTRVVMLPPRPDDGLVAYVGQPPKGWGANGFSVKIENVAARWSDITYNHEPFCHVEVKIDGQPVVFVRPAGAGTNILHAPAQGASGPESKSFLPPGMTAYLFVPSIGKHSWQAYCYERPPQSFRMMGGQLSPVTSVFQLSESASGEIMTNYGQSVYLCGRCFSPVSSKR